MRRLLTVRPRALALAGTILAGTALAAALLAAGCGASGPAAGGVPVGAGQPGAVRYYLALGDSLARGVQADPAGLSVPTPRGYPDQLVALLRRREPGLRLAKLGCSGETTLSMINGRHCAYPAGSQLDAAVAFLRAHRGAVQLITVDIGANDPDSCFTNPVPGPVPPCAAGPVPATAANLATILARLRAAAGRGVTIIGMSYYAPELADWRDGPAGRAVARRSAQLTLAFSQFLAGVYHAHGAGVADVAAAFRTADFSGRVPVPGLGRLPRNVAAVCAWTWVCAAPPRGPNKHPDTAGYAVIARAFLAAYGR
jgi:lysophospholipase L1-like esterase